MSKNCVIEIKPDTMSRLKKRRSTKNEEMDITIQRLLDGEELGK